MKMSLIIATLGRKKELLELLNSINNSNINKINIEILIIDQNHKGFLENELLAFNDLNIKHIHSIRKGLSYNRNIGLKIATGEIICFPDDDCKFYEDTLQIASKVLSCSKIDFCIGRIFDRNTKKNIIKKWPSKKFKINRFNSYFVNSSITLFIKKSSILDFDEKLGVGSVFGSCEDADLIYRVLESGAKGVYTPEIELWHPSPDFQDIPLSKVKSYASGFGYFISKNTDLTKFFLLILLINKKLFEMFFNIFTKKYQKKYFLCFFSGLVSGLRKNE